MNNKIGVYKEELWNINGYAHSYPEAMNNLIRDFQHHEELFFFLAYALKSMVSLHFSINIIE